MKYLLLLVALISVSLLGAVVAANFAEHMEQKTQAQFTVLEERLSAQQSVETARVSRENRLMLGALEDDFAAEQMLIHSRLSQVGKRMTDNRNEVHVQLENVREEIERVKRADFSQVIAQVTQSVVKIEVVSGKGITLAHATGFFVDDDMIVTNRHVVETDDLCSWFFFGFYLGQNPDCDGTFNYKVIKQNGEVGEAQVRKVSDVYDLALLESDLEGRSLEFTNAYIGLEVAVVGNPLQDGLEFSAAKGIVTNLERDIDDGSGAIYIQTDASTYPGNSGSPIFTQDGEVVGILSAGPEFEENIGWAIPSRIIVNEFNLN